MQAVIFDLDGTLIDTEPSAAAAVRECFHRWGVPIDPHDATYITGRTWASAFDYLFAKYPLPVPAKQASQEMLDAYREELEKNLIIVPGGADAVKALAAKLPLGLVSGSYRSEILWALGKLGILDHFQIILGAEDYPKSKPAPDGYLKALGTLGVSASKTLVFEDSTAGIQSARAAGMWVVAITGTNHFKQDTTQAHQWIPDLRGIDVDWVMKLADALQS